ncbi:MAG: LemA family protein [Planctomycetes bacterium]|nr:LemA family protein [Planctomycetota bacterium]
MPGNITRKFISVLLLLFITTGLAGCGVNAIPSLDEETTAKWSQVINQYQRRADLIPNLVEVVKGYAKHERETLTAVVEARSKISQMTIPKDILTNKNAFQLFQQNQGQLTSALSKLMLVVERYPDLKASQNYSNLQSQLEGTENRIAVARRDYIEAIKEYNTEIRTFPGRIWAALLYEDAEVKQNFTVENSKAIETAPKINLSQ